MGGRGRLLIPLRVGLVALLLPLYLFSLHCFSSSSSSITITTTTASSTENNSGATTMQPSIVAQRTAAATTKTSASASETETGTTVPRSQNTQDHARSSTTNPSSILLTPCEIYWDSVVRVALQELSSPTSNQDYGDSSSRWKTALQSCYYENKHNNNNNNNHQQLMLTVTLVGYKGGKLIDQINQDRAFVYSTTNNNAFLSGVMDGHGSLGHSVAEFGRHALLQRLPSKVQQLLAFSTKTDSSTTIDESQSTMIEQIIQQTVTDIDRDLPEYMASAGGATASFVLSVPNNHQHDNDATLYFSNTGDSQSFLVAAILNVTTTTTTPDSNNNKNNQRVELLDTQIPLVTQPHKPDHPVERQRLEAAGMRVEHDAGYEDSARAWYKAADGGTYGLAMSRALGDRGARGVTALPDVRTVPSLRKLAAALAHEYNEKLLLVQQQQPPEPVCTNAPVDTNGNSDDATCTTTRTTNNATLNTDLIQQDQIHFFVVSATDGLLDYLTPEIMGVQLAMALYESDNNKHAMTAASDLLHQSSGLWHTENRGEYRDDMALAVVQIS